MEGRMRRLGERVWGLLLSPKTVTTFKVMGLALQALHEVENFRREHHRGNKIGFQ